jgi:hypothetical protein
VERPPGVADSLRQALAGPPAGQFCLSPGHSLLPWGARAFSCLDRGRAWRCFAGPVTGSVYGGVCGSCHGLGVACSPHPAPLVQLASLAACGVLGTRGSHTTRSPVPPAHRSSQADRSTVPPAQPLFTSSAIRFAPVNPWARSSRADRSTVPPRTTLARVLCDPFRSSESWAARREQIARPCHPAPTRARPLRSVSLRRFSPRYRRRRGRNARFGCVYALLTNPNAIGGLFRMSPRKQT